MNTVPHPLLIAEVSALLMLSVGCSSLQSTAEVKVVEGCLFEVKGLSMSQATEITKSWDFSDNCNIKVKSDLDQ